MAVRNGLTFGLAFIVTLFALLPAAVFAQQYPVRPLRFIIGFGVGGSTDVISRLLADKLSARLGQPVVPENRPAASGIIANETVARAAPDGHALVLLTGGFPVGVVMLKKMPFDPEKDFSPVSIVTSYPFGVAVAADAPFRTLADLITHSKANPGKLSYSTTGPAGLHHLLGELINIEAGTSLVGIPYKGSAQGLTDLLGGRIEVMVETATFLIPNARAGKLRILALSSAVRHPLLPDVPSIAETVLAVEAESWLGLATTGGTPASVVSRLNQDLRAILKMPDVAQQLVALGGVASPSSPEEMAQRIKREIVRWTRVATVKGIPKQ